MYLFVRRITQQRRSGFISALIFTFGGYLTGYPAQQLAVLEVNVWLPLILFFVDRVLLNRAPHHFPVRHAKLITHLNPPRHREKSAVLRDCFLAGGSFGLAILAGHPQSWLIVGCTFVAYFIFLIVTVPSLNPSQHWGREGWKLLLICVVGLSLAAVQLIPAVEYMFLSVRAAGVYDTMSGGFPFTDSIQILLPSIISFYSPLYIGITGLLLVILALFYQTGVALRSTEGLVFARAAPISETIFWGAWAGLTFLLSFGGNTFLYAALYLALTPFSMFRGQERWAFAVAFSLAVLAGYGLKKTLRHIVPFAGWFLLGAIGMVIMFFYGLNDTGWSTENQFYQLLGASTFLAILLCLNVVVFKLENPFLLSILIIFDLFTINWQTNLYPQLPEWHSQKPAIIEVLQADVGDSQDLFRVYNEFRLYDNYGIPFELQDLWGASPLRLSRYDQFLKPPMRIERAWAMLNVKYVITWRKELYVPSTILYEEETLNGDVTYLHRLESVGTRAWLVHQIKKVDETSMIATLSDPNFNFYDVALIEEQSQLQTLDSKLSIFNEHVEIMSYEPNRIELQVDAKEDGLLILSEVYYPGWRAMIDNQAVPIVQTNYILRAVPISSGNHHVVVQFVPFTFWLGMVISVMTIIIIIATQSVVTRIFTVSCY
ncbi:MAG: hypothetical protein B6242_14880 [Anaerolineaceae bacterium 4572_78]|nr:MAG: hypothetical protein B6242_14880 [Anaerolineaceae bacterium 4572_78]